jgi:type II secretory pathway component PulF
LFSKKIKQDDIISFTRQFHMLLSSGMPLQDSLKITHTFGKNPAFTKVLETIMTDVKSGKQFSECLLPHQKHFGPDYIALIKAGENSGTLEKMLQDLHLLLSWEKDLKKRIGNAVRYPIIVISVAFIAMIGMFKFVVPKFAAVFSRSNQQLPLPTRVLLILNNFFTQYTGALLLFMLISGISITYLYRKYPKFRNKVDHYVLRIPVVGLILKNYILIRFCKVFSILYEKGVSIIEALSTCKNINNNAFYQFEIEGLIYKTERGNLLGDSTDQTILFSGIVSQMIAIGEKSSNLDSMIEKIGELYADETNYLLDNFFAYIEPLFIIIMGMLILGLAFGIFLPMWQMINILATN